MKLQAINPERLCRPRGYSHAVKGHGDLVFVAGQIGADREGRIVSADLVEQFGQALDNVLDAVWAAGGSPESIARMLIFVADRKEYRQREKQLGVAWRKRMGRHYPAMSLVEVAALYDDGAKVEIEAVALV